MYEVHFTKDYFDNTHVETKLHTRSYRQPTVDNTRISIPAMSTGIQ